MEAISRGSWANTFTVGAARRRLRKSVPSRRTSNRRPNLSHSSRRQRSRVGCGASDHKHPTGAVALGEIAQHQACLGGLAQPGVVGNQKAWARVSRGAHQRHELVGLNCDRPPVEPDESLATADHRGRGKPGASLSIEAEKSSRLQVGSDPARRVRSHSAQVEGEARRPGHRWPDRSRPVGRTHPRDRGSANAGRANGSYVRSRVRLQLREGSRPSTASMPSLPRQARARSQQAGARAKCRAHRWPARPRYCARRAGR